MDLRNVAIIAHVDHGKTTLVDGLLKQSKTFRENEAEMSQVLIMDSNDQERERGITILAKNTSVHYKDTKINIIDTPGHADFGGEVERTLNMADGALLLIDAQEGPMPQTKFVLKKALEIGLKLIVVINKIDKRDAHILETINKTYDLFLDLATDDSQLDFPVLFSISRDGKAWDELPKDSTEAADLTPIFDAIIKYIPAPEAEIDKPFQMQVSTLDWDSFQGKYAIGRITRGIAKKGLSIVALNTDGVKENSKIDKMFTSEGLKRIEIQEAIAGDIIAITGIASANIGDTLCDVSTPEALPAIKIEEPTLKMAISANTSPFAGKDGQFLTGRQILDRIKKELQTNVSLRLEENGTEFILSGRGELHLSVFIETLRREGYELQVGKPHVIEKVIDGVKSEPIEELTVDVDTDKVGAVTAEIGRRKGIMISQEEGSDKSTRLIFEISTRGLLGLRNQLLTISRGTAVMNSMFLRYEPLGTPIPKLRNGVLIASEAGKAVTYGLNIAQGRGSTFIPPQTEVYAGMIIGMNNRDEDIEINVTKEKKQTNVRASSSDISVILTPPIVLSLEQALDFLEDDEFLEATPKNLRLRKKILNATLRTKARKQA
ncbi:MAG: GTP-binding protein [Berkelbacteria bacterium GW2011_GWE1_39_12]|uniref:50S ribosomal subunit assembly factor BipA n=1 Tax=Berkelbacteria bacterium GW2011_GWE1_39_12 TaxID=1618337 RepID=A0A0G4B681_9BACT|nr:MAG: GTP-binding protein [Berkelbacteria bacterium GW2011_GWE1_39_12]